LFYYITKKTKSTYIVKTIARRGSKRISKEGKNILRRKYILRRKKEYLRRKYILRRKKEYI